MAEKIFMKSGAAVAGTAFRHRAVVVATLCVGIMAAYMDRVNVAVLAANETFLRDMGIMGEPVRIGMLMSVFLGAYALANIFAARLGGRLGARGAMILSIVLWLVALCVGGSAPGFAVMICARIIMGMGEGFYYPLQSVIVKRWIPPGERGRANACWAIGQSVAPAVTMPFLSWVVALWGWREGFYALMPVTLIPLIMFCFLVTDTPRRCKRVRPDELEAIEAALDGEMDARPKESRWRDFRRLSARRDYRLLVFWYVALNIIYWGLISWLPSYLKEAREFSWQLTGWLSSLPFVLTIISKACSGWVVDKTGRCAPLLALGMFGGACCIFGAVTLEDNYLAVASLACAFACVSMGLPSAWTLLQKLAPAHIVDVAGGVMVGTATGISAFSPVFMGLCISFSDGYAGGLYMLMGVALAAGSAACLLAAARQ